MPLKVRLGEDETRWSEALESVRKDVECVFGRLKRRFLFLKNSIQIHDIETIDLAVYTCCILSNMLLEFDGYDASRWDSTLEAITASKSAVSAKESPILKQLQARVHVAMDMDKELESIEEQIASLDDEEQAVLDQNSRGRLIRFTSDHSVRDLEAQSRLAEATIQRQQISDGISEALSIQEEELCSDVAKHELLRSFLVNHYKVQHSKGQIFWLRGGLYDAPSKH